MYSMKLKKLVLSLTFIIFALVLTSCNKSITLINEVINRNVNYEENISILDFEDAIVEATAIATESSVGVMASLGSIFFGTESFGSGTVIKKEEIAKDLYEYYVLTNRHVVLTDNGNKRNIKIRFEDKQEVDAEICVYDVAVDVAIVKFQSSRIINPTKISLDNLEAGRFVVAVGSPHDIESYYNTATVGNISHNNRVIEEEDMRGNLVKNIYIQHTAALNSGNSGGGLFNIKGELIGINCWKIVDEEIEGMNFSIPLKEVYNKYKQYFE